MIADDIQSWHIYTRRAVENLLIFQKEKENVKWMFLEVFKNEMNKKKKINENANMTPKMM